MSKGVPHSSDDARSSSADTNSSTTYRPASSGSGGGVTPELVLVDPELALAQRQTRNRKAAMPSTEPANTFPEPAQPAPGSSSTPVTSPDKSMIDVPLGTLIFRAGLLGEEQLEDALQEGMRTGKRLGEVLLERGWLEERDLGLMLAGQKGLPFVDVSVSDVEPEALNALGEDDARRQVALPLLYEDGELVIAVGDPSNELVLEGLRRAIETDFQLVVAPHSQLQHVIEQAYARPEPAPAPHLEGVLFPDLHPAAKNAAPAELEPEPDLGFASTIEADPEPDAEEKPFSGSTPTLISRMLFPSVRHAAQEAETAVADDEPAEEFAAEEPAPEEAPEPEVSAPEPAVEPAAEEPAAEAAPEPEAFVPEPEEPAAAEPTPEEAPEPEASAPEPAEAPAPESAEELTPEPAEPPPAAAEEDFAELEVPSVPEMPVPSFEQPAAEAEPPPPEEAPEPAAEQPADAAQPATHAVLVRLRDGESLRIGEHGTAAEASEQAADAVAQISSAAGNGTWPLFAGRYLSPDTIVSVDLIEESPDA